MCPTLWPPLVEQNRPSVPLLLQGVPHPKPKVNWLPTSAATTQGPYQAPTLPGPGNLKSIPVAPASHPRPLCHSRVRKGLEGYAWKPWEVRDRWALRPKTTWWQPEGTAGRRQQCVCRGQGPLSSFFCKRPTLPHLSTQAAPRPLRPGSPAQGGLGISPPPRSAGPASPETLEPRRKRGGAGRWGCVGRRRCWVL